MKLLQTGESKFEKDALAFALSRFDEIENIDTFIEDLNKTLESKSLPSSSTLLMKYKYGKTNVGEDTDEDAESRLKAIVQNAS